MPSHDPSPGPTLHVRRATKADLPRIVVIEHESFSAPWPVWMLAQEIEAPDGMCLVLEERGSDARPVVGHPVLAYAGMRTVLDEGHVVTLAVPRDRRREGLGEALAVCLLEAGRAAGITRVILEHRISNLPATKLYEKLGFQRVRLRRGYYTDSGEDAVEAMLSDLDGPESGRRLAGLRAAWEVKHGRPLPHFAQPPAGD